jgi:hypothetical protein
MSNDGINSIWSVIQMLQQQISITSRKLKKRQLKVYKTITVTIEKHRISVTITIKAQHIY